MVKTVTLELVKTVCTAKADARAFDLSTTTEPNNKVPPLKHSAVTIAYFPVAIVYAPVFPDVEPPLPGLKTKGCTMLISYILRLGKREMLQVPLVFESSQAADDRQHS